MKYLLSLAGLFFSFFLFGQKVQWAHQLIKYSSQHSNTVGAAREVLGPPNMMTTYENPLELAWTPSSDDDNGEYVEVKFQYGMRVSQYLICESLNPGSIAKVFLIDTKGKEYKVYENNAPKAIGKPNNWFSQKIAMTPYNVIGLKVVLKTKNVPGRQQIDAIAISDGSSPIKPTINNISYSTPPGKPENLGPNINSSFSERNPIINPNGKTLYFARKFHPDNKGDADHDDIWVAHLQPNGMWSPAKNIGEPLNNKEHNFVFGISLDGEKIYLGNDYKRNNKDGVSVSENKGTWQFPSPLNIQDHYNQSAFVGYTISVNEDVLLMAVQRTEGLGDRDIYVSFKRGNNWTTPKNLGNIINTPGMESNIFLAADTKTIYFASSGHAGYGGLDMFIARRLDDSWTNWTTPANLGSAINTPGNDFHYTIPAAGDYAYFSSDFNSLGQSDIFRIRLPKEARPEPVRVITKKYVDAPLAKGKEMVNKNDKTETPLQFGYYEAPEENNQLEDLDYDGNDSKILEANLQDQRNQKTAAPNQELALLQEKINRLNAPTQPKAGQGSSQPTKSNEMVEPVYALSKEKLSTTQPVSESDELARLKAKYSIGVAKNTVTPVAPKAVEIPTQETYQVQEYDKNQTDAEIQALADQLEAEPDAVTQQKLADMLAAQQGLESLDDDIDHREIQNMQDQLAASERKAIKRVEAKPVTLENPDQYRVNKEIPTTTTDDAKAVNYDKYRDIAKIPTKEEVLAKENAAQQKEKEKEDLAKLKEKFARTSGQTVPSQPTTTETVVIPTTPTQPNVITTPSESTEKDAIPTNTTLDDATFEAVAFDVKTQLREEMIAEVQRSLHDELLVTLEDEVKKELEASLEIQLKEELTDRVENDLRKDLEAVIVDDITKEQTPLIQAQLKNELKEDVITDLRNSLKEEVAQELRQQLEEPIKTQMKQEIEARYKKELERQLRSDLESKIRAQIEQEYRVAANKNTSENSVNQEAVTEEVLMVPIKVGAIIPLNNIFFEANKSDLKELSVTELNNAYEFLLANPAVIVEIGGHTNGLCSDEFAAELSKGRAKKVKDWLVAKGIPERRIDFHGYGKLQPVADNATIEGRKKNQRVEMKIITIE